MRKLLFLAVIALSLMSIILAGCQNLAGNATDGIVPKLGSLYVTSNPTGASLYVNNILKGMTPVTVRLIEGNYSISLMKPGYQNYSTSARVSGGKTTKVSATLIPVSGSAWCKDTDSGINYQLKGTCTDSLNRTYTDSCNPNVFGRVNEAFCQGNTCSYVAYDNVCPFGCSAGACLQNSTAGGCGDRICSAGESCGSCPQDCYCTKRCTDSDGGINYYLRGSVGYSLYQNGVLIANSSMIDICSGSGLLYEYYCSVANETNYVTTGCNCLNGACLQNTSSPVQLTS